MIQIRAAEEAILRLARDSGRSQVIIMVKQFNLPLSIVLLIASMLGNNACSEEQVLRHGKKTLQQWIDQLRNSPEDDYLKRVEASSAIMQIGKPAVPHLLAFLDSPEITNRNIESVIYSLGRIGPLAIAAVPKLKIYLKDEKSENIRESSTRALANIIENENELVDLMLVALADKSKSVVETALGVLKKRGKSSKQVVAQIARLVEFGDESSLFLTVTAIKTLQEFGDSAIDAVPSLVKCMNNNDTIIKATAIDALTTIAGATPTVRDAVAKHAEDPHEIVREAVLRFQKKSSPTNREVQHAPKN
jgi:HEAT repeat protein